MIIALLILVGILWFGDIIDHIKDGKSNILITGAVFTLLFWDVSLATSIVIIVFTFLVMVIGYTTNN